MTKGKDTNVLATLPIETKLTRGEVVEMLIEQLVGDLTMRRERLDAEYKELSKLSPSELKKLDQVAYVRFASVYRDFQDVSHFMKELKFLLAKPK